MTFKQSKMKRVFLVIVALCVVAQAQVENKWTKVESTLDTPQFQEFLRRMYPDSIERDTRQITGGQTATWEPIPYQALLVLNGYGCGGSIISQAWILTAAHCLIGQQFATVYHGFYHENSMYYAWAIKVYKNNFIIHEEYDPLGVSNNIALIRLDSKIPENQYASSISLPTRADVNEHLIGTTVNVSGFGRYSDRSTKFSPVLRYVEVPIVVNSFCEDHLKRPVLESNICIWNQNRKSPCSGDSGGPLAMLGPNEKPVLVGIVPVGFLARCEKGHPVVFARVDSFLDWIEAKSGIEIS